MSQCNTQIDQLHSLTHFHSFRWIVAVLNFLLSVFTLSNLVVVWRYQRKLKNNLYHSLSHVFFFFAALFRTAHFSLGPYRTPAALSYWIWSIPFNLTFVGYCLIVLNLVLLVLQQGQLTPKFFTSCVKIFKRKVRVGDVKQKYYVGLRLDISYMIKALLVNSFFLLFFPDALLRCMQAFLPIDSHTAQSYWLVFFGTLVVLLNFVLLWSVIRIDQLLEFYSNGVELRTSSNHAKLGTPSKYQCDHHESPDMENDQFNKKLKSTEKKTAPHTPILKTALKKSVARLKLIVVSTHVISVFFLTSIFLGIFFQWICRSYSTWIIYDSVLIGCQCIAVLVMSGFMSLAARSQSIVQKN